MKKTKFLITVLLIILLSNQKILACSILYYIDSISGKVFVVNNEDYWYNVDAFVKIEPKSKKEYARLWYGWDKFAQGGVNEKGLFFDAAVTPEQKKINGYGNPNSNLGDDILANCSNVIEVLEYLEKRKIGLTKSHMIFGDKTGNAVVIEWVGGEKKLHWIKDNKLLITNFLLSDTTAGNYPCYRYESINKNIKELESTTKEINLLQIGNTFRNAVQPPKEIEKNKIGGTLYTSFINLSDMEFVLSYKLSSEKVLKLDLRKEFEKTKKQKLMLEDTK